jgi:alpha-L-arabinofuranosidase
VEHDRHQLALNRDLDKGRELTVTWRDGAPARVVSAEVLTGRDLKATNTLDAPSTVVPRALPAPRVGADTTFELPARSYSVIRFAKS